LTGKGEPDEVVGDGTAVIASNEELPIHGRILHTGRNSLRKQLVYQNRTERGVDSETYRSDVSEASAEALEALVVRFCPRVEVQKALTEDGAAIIHILKVKVA